MKTRNAIPHSLPRLAFEHAAARLTRILLLAAALAGFAAPAWAFDPDKLDPAGEDPLSVCMTRYGKSFEERLPACNAALASPGLSAKDQAILYTERGRTFDRHGMDAEAAADYTAAIDLAPETEDVLVLRAEVYTLLGNYDGALADLEQNARLHPDNSTLRLAARSRGKIHFLRGQYALAAEAFRDSVRRSDGLYAYYDAVVLYLSNVRAADPVAARQELAENWASLRYNPLFPEWPSPVALFFLGKLSVADLRKAAVTKADEPKLQLCDVDFYVGQWHLMNRRRDQARTLFEKVKADCYAWTFSFMGAVAALKAMDSAAPPATPPSTGGQP